MANTATQMIVAVGAIVAIRCESLEVSCIVVDVKNAYGRERMLVKPVAGDGSQWVEMSRVIRVVTSAAAAEMIRRGSVL